MGNKVTTAIRCRIGRAGGEGLRTHLAGQDGTESGKGVMKSLVINRLLKVLDEQVSNAALTLSGVAMAPHDADGLAIDLGVVEGLQRAVRRMLCGSKCPCNTTC